MVLEQLKGTPASPGETKGSASAPLRRLVVVGEEMGMGKRGLASSARLMGVACVHV